MELAYLLGGQPTRPICGDAQTVWSLLDAQTRGEDDLETSIDRLDLKLGPGRHPELIAQWLWHGQAA